MRWILRRAAALAVVVSLLGGLSLPFQPVSVAADADGLCGPVLSLEHSVEHFEAPRPAPDDHCAVCHWWSALAHASLAATAAVVPPRDPAAGIRHSSLDRPGRLVAGDAAPRAPPATV